MSSGRIVQIIGAVIDVEFPREAVPQVYDALKVPEKDLTLEVQQQLGDGVVRAIAMGSSEGVSRGLSVENTGALATHVARGADLPGNREDAIWLIGDRDRMKFLQGGAWQSLGVLDGTMEIPGYNPPTPGGGRAQAQPQMPAFMRQQAPPDAEVSGDGNTRTVTWLVSMEGSVPLKLVLTSQKGGTKVHNLTVR